MPHTAPGSGSGLTAAKLVALLPGGNPPRHSNLNARTWERAARLFAQSGGRISLKMLGQECGVSHRTAWRMRETLRDSAQMLCENRTQAASTHH
jgi:hypothetical protein